jgi:hypothetical protein
VATVACQNEAIQLLSASPNNGYEMRVDSAGPTNVRVEFASSQAESEITATCVNSKPSATVYNDE